ncbi:TIGR00730 family Rossman fold protein [Methylocella sp.]|uniref:TIGR00730 family Rossman fold protein n=1 Tax=Methylocella sp. TaxID=1978226 RepID=UPI003784C29E
MTDAFPRVEDALSPPEAETSRIRSVCVYCGSARGVEPVYAAAAGELGRLIAQDGLELVYGGGGLGLMGAVARAAVAAGGVVTGVIPEFLHRKEGLFADVSQTIVVPDMHTRKRLMFERADAFVALPGGVGTLEELVEQLTWVQLERHTKPVVIADVDGFWRPLIDLFAHMRERRFIQPSFEVRYLVAEKIGDVLPMIRAAAARTDRLGLRKETVDPRL